MRLCIRNEMNIWIYLILVAGATGCTGRTYILAVDFHLVHQYNSMFIRYVIIRMYWVPLSLSQELVTSYIGLGQVVGFVLKKISKIWLFICDKNKITKDDNLILALGVIHTSLTNRWFLYTYFIPLGLANLNESSIIPWFLYAFMIIFIS